MANPINYDVLKGALYAGWRDDVDALGPAVVDDLISAPDLLDYASGAARFDLKTTADIVLLALGLIVTIMDLVTHLRSTSGNTLTVEDILAALKKDLPNGVTEEEVTLAVIYVVNRQSELRDHSSSRIER